MKFKPPEPKLSRKIRRCKHKKGVKIYCAKCRSGTFLASGECAKCGYNGSLYKTLKKHKWTTHTKH